jgi:hypothetical protein
MKNDDRICGFNRTLHGCLRHPDGDQKFFERHEQAFVVRFDRGFAGAGLNHLVYLGPQSQALK